MIASIKNFIDQYHLLPQESSVIVGLSGGPDSIFLLYFLVNELKEKKLKLTAAHLDHQWRPDSHSDVLFCQKVCEDLEVSFISARASELALDLKKSGSLEEQGRIMRRFFLEKVQKEQNADLIALAHHADDQEETFFIRLIRGTTLSGLIGMQPKSGPYVRPLLMTLKRDILAYVQNHRIAYLVDPTNERPEFLRNRIRQTVIPALRACDERFDTNFLSTIASLKQAEQALHQLTVQTFNDLAVHEQDTWYIDIEKLLALSSYLRNRILIHWLIIEHVPFTPTQQFFEEIIRFLQQPSSKHHTLGKTWGIAKKKHRAWTYTIP